MFNNMQFVSKTSLSGVVVMEPRDMEGHLYYSKPNIYIYVYIISCSLILKKLNHHDISKYSYLYNTIKSLTHCIPLFNFILLKYSLNILSYLLISMMLTKQIHVNNILMDITQYTVNI